MLGIGCYFYSNNRGAVKLVTQNHKAEAISFYDYCLTNANVIILFSLFFSWTALPAWYMLGAVQQLQN